MPVGKIQHGFPSESFEDFYQKAQYVQKYRLVPMIRRIAKVTAAATYVSDEPKGLQRIAQKIAMKRMSDTEFSYHNISDVCRAMLIFVSMNELIGALQIIRNHVTFPSLTVLMVENRFAPNVAKANSWQDVTLLVQFEDGLRDESGRGIVCEIQLGLLAFVVKRKLFGGHASYTAFREGNDFMKVARQRGLPIKREKNVIQESDLNLNDAQYERYNDSH